MISAILFDFDGVLIDSLPVMRKSWNSVQNKYNLKVNFEHFKNHIGIPFESILSNLEINSKLHKSIHEHYSLIASQNKKLIKLNPYARLILNWLNKKSIKTGIVTSKDNLRTIELIEFFQLNFNSIVTPELTQRGKPAPDPIIFAAKELSVDINKVLFIGDMLSDMKCAFNANCSYLHYLNGYQKLRNHPYGGEISSLKEIIEYITYF